MQLGLRRVVVLNSSHWLTQAFVRQGDMFNHRPRGTVLSFIMGGKGKSSADLVLFIFFLTSSTILRHVEVEEIIDRYCEIPFHFFMSRFLSYQSHYLWKWPCLLFALRKINVNLSRKPDIILYTSGYFSLPLFRQPALENDS